MSTLPDWTQKYISLPYEEMDCWELVQKVYASEFNIHVGGVTDQRDNLRDKEWIDVLEDVDGYVVGDVLLFKNSVVNKHVGIMVTSDLMLHACSGTNSCIERWRTPLWEKRLIGIYHHANR